MSVKFILGASGHGKTYRLYENIIKEACANPDINYYIIVPEQSSLQAEKDIVRMHPNGGVFNITVLTFGRMAYRIFDELGMDVSGSIDDTGKNLIIRSLIDNVADRMKIIKPSHRQGFISEIKSVISEFKQYGIKPDDLENIINKTGNDRLRDKLRDILLIYREFENYIAGKYITPEDKPEKMLSVMDRSVLFNKAVIAFDGFTGFTPVQYKIIEKMIMQAGEIICTVTIPQDVPYNVTHTDGIENDLFFMSKTIMRRIGEIADRLHVHTEYDVINTDYDKYRFSKSKELDFLEKNIFRYNNRKYMEPVNDIGIYRLKNPKSEVAFMASAILRMVREQNIRFRDIAIIVGDIDMYSDEIVRVFTESGIPFFVDSKRDLIGNPLVEYLRAAMQIIYDDFSYESVFRFLKNIFCTIDRDNVDILENYIVAYAIRGAGKWNENFVKKYPGKSKDMLVVNDTRRTLWEIMEPLYKVFKNENSHVKDYVRALYDFMEEQNLYERMEELWKQLEDNSGNDLSMTARADQYKQAYNNIVELFDRTNTLLGDEIVSAEEFAEILDAGFEEIKVGIIPPGVDCVTVGNVERTRLEHVKVLFLAGVNEGIMPKMAANKGVLSEMERKILGDMEVELAPSPRDRIFIQNYYMYLNLTEPEMALYVCYHFLNGSGEESRPSRICQMIKNMYPMMKEHEFEYLEPSQLITNAKNSFHLALSCENISLQDALLKYFTGTKPYCDQLEKIVEIYEKECKTESLTPAVAKELYGDINRSSISKIEKYAGCAFSHFVSYGLELTQREEYALNNMDLGNVFHEALEIMSNNMLKDGLDFSLVDNNKRQEYVNGAVDEAIFKYERNSFYDNSTNLYMKKRVTEMVSYTAWALGRQLESGKFKPVAFEKEFKDEVDGININGKIDRIDIYENDNEAYVKIIDYKSGKHNLSVQEIYAGIKLQLMVYLKSTMDELKKQRRYTKVVPAAVLYNHIDNPILEEKKDIEKELLNQMAPTGMVSDEGAEALSCYSEDGIKVIPGKKDTVSTKQLNALSEFATKKMTQLQKEINAGSIEVNPYEDSCEYCSYRGICGFNEKNGSYRKLKDCVPDTGEIWESLGFESDKEEK